MNAKQLTRTQGIMLVIALIVVAVNFRAVVTTLSASLAEVQAATGMSSGMAGVLTALPGFIFGVVGYVTPNLSKRVGINAALAIAMALVALGLFGRAGTSSARAFILLSAVGLAGIAIGNVLAPAFVRAYFPGRMTGMMMVYTIALGVGTVVSAGVSAPIAQATSWRVNQCVWAVIALIAVLVMLVVLVFRVGGCARTAGVTGAFALLRQPKAVWLSVFFGLQSAQAYVQMGWLGQIARDQGVSATEAGYMIAVLQLVIIIGAFVAPVLLHRFSRPSVVVFVLAISTIPAYAGVLWLPSLMWLWIIVLIASNLCFPLALSLIASSGSSVEATASLSALAQGCGYIIAGFGPLLVGLLHSVTGGWTVPLVVMMVSCVPFAVAGFKAAQPGFVE